MATLADVKKLGRQLGAIVTQDRVGDSIMLEVEAPTGMRWAEELHMFVDSAYLPWKPDYDDMLDRMKSYTLEKCDDPDCDWCNSEED